MADYKTKFALIAGPGVEKVLYTSIPIIKKLYPEYTVTIVGSEQTLSYFKSSPDIMLINENSVLEKSEFLNLYVKIFNTTGSGTWYYQQFLKYSLVNTIDDASNYYVVWDADTIPLKKVPIKDGDVYLFNRKTEFHTPYFDTISRLFPGINIENKCDYGHSFITEYMAFDKVLLKDMLARIGNKWIETILLNIDKRDFRRCGFSEYETYGTYITNYYPECMKNIQLKTEREGWKLFNAIPTTEQLMKRNLDLDTITFE